jgi:hypothetical protein
MEHEAYAKGRGRKTRGKRKTSWKRKTRLMKRTERIRRNRLQACHHQDRYRASG